MPLNLSPFLAKKLKKDGHIWPLSIRFSPKSIDMPDGKSPLCPAVTGVLPGVSLGQPFVDKANAQPLGNQSPCNVNIILIDHSALRIKTLCLKETVRHLVEPGALCTENKMLASHILRTQIGKIVFQIKSCFPQDSILSRDSQ